ncbi:MAG: hypothetical protein AABZ67_00475 [Pseudomonadota bacterium]
MADRKDFIQAANTGQLFPNLRRTSERSPHYTGTMNIEGVLYDLYARVRKMRNGNDFFFIQARKRSDRTWLNRLDNQEPAAKTFGDVKWE